MKFLPKKTDHMPIKAGPADDRLSNDDLARFLKGLAYLYKDEHIGNPKLSRALADLATNLNRTHVGAKTKSLPRSENVVATTQKLERLKNLDARSVEQILADPNRSKSDLIDVAWARFSIARGNLQKSSIEMVRKAIRSALANEKSISIILQEAHKRGAQRSS